MEGKEGTVWNRSGLRKPSFRRSESAQTCAKRSRVNPDRSKNFTASPPRNRPSLSGPVLTQNTRKRTHLNLQRRTISRRSISSRLMTFEINETLSTTRFRNLTRRQIAHSKWQIQLPRNAKLNWISRPCTDT